MTNRIVVAASGYFDPLHVGHVDYLKRAKQLGDHLIVVVNNREQALAKKGYEFMPFEERFEVVKALACVDEVMRCFDTDGSVCQTLVHLKPHIFAKGGDRLASNIPESRTCQECGVEIVDGLGEKLQSSSDLIAKYQELKDKRE
jgi:cytidyltransferase-like protein